MDTKRYKDMKNIFAEKSANIPDKKIIYKTSHFNIFNKFIIGVTVLFPGKVGNEHHMTTGHIHKKRNKEIYFFLSKNFILLENDVEQDLYYTRKPKRILITNGNLAHRVINTSNKKCVFFTVSKATEYDYNAFGRNRK